MNKEIKEILDKISSEKYYIQHSYCRLFNYEANTLLDYITNLQQEIYKQIHTSIVQKKQIKNLQQENERLKKPDYYEKGLIGSIKERDEIIQDYKQENEKLKELESCTDEDTIWLKRMAGEE